STITLTLQDLTVPTSYYTGTAWQNGATTFPAQGPVTPWTFANAGLIFVNDRQYRLTATARDSAGNTTPASVAFVYDIQKPTSSVTSPNTVFISTWTSISGKASDQPGSPLHPSGIAATGVSVAVQVFGGNWWDGASFSQGTPAYQTTTFT